MSDYLLLEPCPLCGGKAHFFRIDDLNERNFGGQGVCCERTCCAEIGLMFATLNDPKPILAERWNNRADDDRRYKALLRHWREFGPDYGFDELIESLASKDIAGA